MGLALPAREKHPLQSLRRINGRRLLKLGVLLIRRLRRALILSWLVVLVLGRMVVSCLGVIWVRLRPCGPHALAEGSSKRWSSGLSVGVTKFIPIKRTTGVASRRGWAGRRR